MSIDIESEMTRPKLTARERRIWRRLYQRGWRICEIKPRIAIFCWVSADGVDSWDGITKFDSRISAIKDAVKASGER